MLCHGAAIAPRAASSTELVSDPNTLDLAFRKRFDSITAHAVQTRVKRPLLELVRRQLILQCDADRLVQLTDDSRNLDVLKGMKDLLSQPRRPQINSRSQLDARGRPGLPDVIRCARRKHARAIISSFLRNSGMHQARLSIAMIFLLFGLSFSTSGATLPSGFVETTVASGIVSPTAMAIAPNGRIFVCSQTGALRVIKNGVLLATPFVTLSVDSVGERGLLGVAFDPHFTLNNYIYLYYTVPGTPSHNRVVRFTANGDVVLPGSRIILLELDPLSTATNHNGGALHFGPDGNLYIAVGDNANGSNSQNLSNLLGKILRINPNGSIPNDNPFIQSTTARHEIWALGLRNPFTFAFRGTTSFMYINDVGESTWEEIDLGQSGANYGWPATEGPTTNPVYKSPVYYYGHDQGCAITGGAFYSSSTPNFPSSYVGKYFFGDYCSGFIRVLNPSTGQATGFLTGASQPVDIQVGDDGSLYYLARGTKSVMKIRYSSNLSPVITTQPASQLISVGYPVTFSVVASGSTPYSYQWRRNGVDISGATAPSYKFSATLADNGAQFRVRVSNAYGSVLSNVATLSVTTDKPPTAQILTPAHGTTYFGGIVVNYSGSASDFEDGDLPASAFTWQVDFHHDTHLHPFIAARTGSKKGSFTIPKRGETSSNVYYILTLKVTDSAGLSKTVVRNILPEKAEMTFVTKPAGLKISLDGQAARLTPFTVTGVVGIIRSISARTPQTLNGSSYVFQAWSDGGSRSHEISTPSVDTTYTANFATQ
jgi:glucose/arabinose dehydrogenase